jgi:hypothetical protein
VTNLNATVKTVAQLEAELALAKAAESKAALSSMGPRELARALAASESNITWGELALLGRKLAAGRCMRAVSRELSQEAAAIFLDAVAAELAEPGNASACVLFGGRAVAAEVAAALG